MDLALAFTGPEVLRPSELARAWDLIVRHLCEVRPDVVLSGGAAGIDTLVLKAAIASHPTAIRVLVIPRDFRWNEAIAPLAHHYVVTPKPGPMARNSLLVERATYVVALPNRSRTLRSGTWATVRRAEAAGKIRAIHRIDLS